MEKLIIVGFPQAFSRPHLFSDLEGMAFLLQPSGVRSWMPESECLQPELSGILRSIPTRVGNTRWEGRNSPPTPVHPHLRGEHCTPPTIQAHGTGSSPPAWGTLYHDRQNGFLERFIPTRVGNTKYESKNTALVRVHPHPRGEHGCGVVPVVISPGSSPPARGTRSVVGISRLYPRFIPTCVGNTPGTRPGGRKGSVHPHLRGEHVFHKVLGCRGTGSSPPAWGTLESDTVRAVGLRFIPTCVGNTITMPF